jgi:transcriptional regulator with XRE-family HTH domain
MYQDGSSYTMRLVERLRQLRRKMDYSQEYMAMVLDISQNAYSRLENGKTPITIDRLYDICHIFQISPCILLESLEEVDSFHAVPAALPEK